MNSYALFTRLVDRGDGDRVHCLGAFPSSKDRGRRGEDSRRRAQFFPIRTNPRLVNNISFFFPKTELNSFQKNPKDLRL